MSIGRLRQARSAHCTEFCSMPLQIDSTTSVGTPAQRLVHTIILPAFPSSLSRSPSHDSRNMTILPSPSRTSIRQRSRTVIVQGSGLCKGTVQLDSFLDVLPRRERLLRQPERECQE